MLSLIWRKQQWLFYNPLKEVPRQRLQQIAWDSQHATTLRLHHRQITATGDYSSNNNPIRWFIIICLGLDSDAACDVKWSVDWKRQWYFCSCLCGRASLLPVSSLFLLTVFSHGSATYSQGVNYPRTSLRWRNQHRSKRGRQSNKPTCRNSKREREKVRVRRFISFYFFFFFFAQFAFPH